MACLGEFGASVGKLVGDFRQAVASANRALELARSAGSERLIQELQSELARYKRMAP